MGLIGPIGRMLIRAHYIMETRPMQEAVPVLSAVALQKTYRKYAIKAEVLRLSLIHI